MMDRMALGAWGLSGEGRRGGWLRPLLLVAALTTGAQAFGAEGFVCGAQCLGLGNQRLALSAQCSMLRAEGPGFSKERGFAPKPSVFQRRGSFRGHTGPQTVLRAAKTGYQILREALQGLPITGGYASLSELFNKYDFDQTGIDTPKLKGALRDLGAPISDSDVDTVMQALDISKDGIVDWDEFCNALEIVEVQMHIESEKMMLEDAKAEERQKARGDGKGLRVLKEALGGLPVTGGYSSFSELFQKYNDKSGYIDGPRLKAALLDLGATVNDEQVASVLDDLDVSGDGVIDWAEFESALQLIEFQLRELM